MNAAPRHSGRRPALVGRQAAIVVALATFLLAFLVRIANLPSAFVGGVPQLSPYDELYHAKRIVYSSQHLFRVLAFDPLRGPAGFFCPWPPLYDMAGGAAARFAGGRTPVEIIARASWFPPLLSAVVAALVAGLLSRRLGASTGLLAGAGVALATFYLDRSRLTSIDHHFLEFPLVVGVIAATALAWEARNAREALRAGALLGLALATALLVQTALLLAAAVVLALVLVAERSRTSARWAAALGFLLAAAIVALYRWMQPAGYPDNEWYLGFPHAAALAGAAAACAAQYVLLTRGSARAGSAVAAVVLGGIVIAAVPGALEAFFEGSRFLRGNPWLESIQEFQPLFRQPTTPFWVDLCLLGGGFFVTATAAVSRRWHRGPRGILLAFALAFSAAALSSRRFLAISGPLTAVTGAIVIADLARERKKALAAAGSAVLLAPSAFLTAGRVVQPPQPVTAEMVPALRVAEYLRSRTDAPGRVIGPWYFGHLFNVVAGRAVLIDNFGTMGGVPDFESSMASTLATREERVAEHCRSRGVRFVVLQDPLPYYAAHVGMSGLPRSGFQSRGPEGDASPTKLMTATFWWRAYFEGGRERPELGLAGRPFRRFRLARTEIGPERSEVRSAVQVWELVGDRP